MKEAIQFSFDGIKSDDMGLMNVDVQSSGMFEEQFIADRQITEVSIKGRDKPYFQGVKRSPLVLSLSFAFQDMYDEEKIRQVARWLDTEYYKPFFTTDNPSRIFYCMLDSSSKLLHNGLKQGYVTIQMRCDSPYTYSPQYLSDLYDYSTISSLVYSDPFTGVNTQLTHSSGTLQLSTSTDGKLYSSGSRNTSCSLTGVTADHLNISWDIDTPMGTSMIVEVSADGTHWSVVKNGDLVPQTISTTLQMRITMFSSPDRNNTPILRGLYVRNGSKKITITNYGDIDCLPEVWFTNVGVGGSICIANLTDGGRESRLTSLVDKEVIYVDSERSHIESSIPNVYRYDNFNDTYLKLVRGINTLVVSGNCQLQFRYQFRTLQG